MALNVDLNDDNWRNKDDKVYHQLTMEEDGTSVVGSDSMYSVDLAYLLDSPSLLSCKPRVTVASCFVYKVIMDLSSAG